MGYNGPGLLPKTGVALAVGGIAIWQLGIIAIAIGLVAVAATTVRVGWRRRKPVSVR